MIEVFFNETGYIVTGEHIEVTRRCSPALTAEGHNIFQPLSHTYKILYLALSELRRANLPEDVMVYGDSRIIDELNGNVSPLDVTHQKWLELLQHRTIPAIRSLVFFRKKPTALVASTIQSFQAKLMPQVNLRPNIPVTNKRNNIVSRFKERWFKNAK